MASRAAAAARPRWWVRCAFVVFSFKWLRCGLRIYLRGVSEPWPFGVSMLVQVPCATRIQASPWKSFFAVPAHEVPGPAAHSFWPALATPKHFSVGFLSDAAWAPAGR